MTVIEGYERAHARAVVLLGIGAVAAGAVQKGEQAGGVAVRFRRHLDALAGLFTQSLGCPRTTSPRSSSVAWSPMPASQRWRHGPLIVPG
ncbi:hypothetical protein, partial [Streptomyces dysideae]|uniref:hypothetical protein n=1 Tax=Streptomyces dysideae TaxID=909626 RepID=UPI001F1FB022